MCRGCRSVTTQLTWEDRGNITTPIEASWHGNSFRITGLFRGIHRWTVDFHPKGLVMWSFNSFFDLSQNKLSIKQSLYRSTETPWRSCDATLKRVCVAVHKMFDNLKPNKTQWRLSQNYFTWRQLNFYVRNFLSGFDCNFPLPHGKLEYPF